MPCGRLLSPFVHKTSVLTTEIFVSKPERHRLPPRNVFNPTVTVNSAGVRRRKHGRGSVGNRDAGGSWGGICGRWGQVLPLVSVLAQASARSRRGSEETPPARRTGCAGRDCKGAPGLLLAALDLANRRRFTSRPKGRTGGRPIRAPGFSVGVGWGCPPGPSLSLSLSLVPRSRSPAGDGRLGDSPAVCQGLLRRVRKSGQPAVEGCAGRSIAEEPAGHSAPAQADSGWGPARGG